MAKVHLTCYLKHQQKIKERKEKREAQAEEEEGEER